jgi:hypothetical protein
LIACLCPCTTDLGPLLSRGLYLAICCSNLPTSWKCQPTSSC